LRLVLARVNESRVAIRVRSPLMKTLPIVGVLLLVLGILSFVVPIPSREDHSVKIGGARIGVQTETSQKLPPAAGIVLLAGGVLAMIIGLRK